MIVVYNGNESFNLDNVKASIVFKVSDSEFILIPDKTIIENEYFIF